MMPIMAAAFDVAVTAANLLLGLPQATLLYDLMLSAARAIPQRCRASYERWRRRFGVRA